MYRGNQQKEQRELPFDFEEAVLSPKERARIQRRGAGAFNPFHTDSDAMVVEEFRICELSARIRTINNARDAMAVLPDGTPLTEVTMYGRRGEVYLVGPLAAVKLVMEGKVPSNLAIRKQIEEARKHVAESIATLTKSLGLFYDGQRSALSFEGCTGGASPKVEETQIRMGHSLMIESCVNEIEALNAEFASLEEEVKNWKWWGPLSDRSRNISDRIATVVGARDGFIKALLVKMVAVPSLESDVHVDTGPQLICETRILIRSISGEVSRLEAFLRKLEHQDKLLNVDLLGWKTQIWQSDIPSIRMSLSNFAEIHTEVQKFEQEILHFLRAERSAREESTEFLNRLSKASQAFESERSAFADDVRYSDRSRVKSAKGVAR